MSKLKILNDNGVTLVELVVTFAVLVILVAGLAFSYEGWIGRYRGESQIKEMYIDLMNARSRSLERNRVHFASIPSGGASYSIYEDTNPGPDGNGTLAMGVLHPPACEGSGSDCLLHTYPKTVQYPITWTGGGTQITFSRNGMISPTGDMVLTTPVDADYDCITITAIKIYMGKMNGSVCEAK